MKRWLIVSAGWIGISSLAAERSPPSAPPAALAIAPVTVVGTSSCSARSCHGGDEPRAERVGRHEFSVWSELDPHTRSYAVLLTDESNRIARLIGSAKPASEEPRCLACHAEPVLENGRTVPHSVGCESCHGAASLWIDPHTLGGDWRDKHPLAAGTFIDVNDLAATAMTCAGCHVGSPASLFGVPRDMNHDMIAAGHPRLTFDFAGYLAQLPPHWNPAKHAGDATFFGRAWAIGQAASALAALDLLEHRTHQPTWPELAEFACASCHHNLRGSDGWRLQRSASPGVPLWGTWHFAALPPLISDAEVRRQLDDLRSLMQKRAPGATVRGAAAPLRPALAALTKSATPPDRSAVIAALRHAAQADWDGAAQLYLALAALGYDRDRAALRSAWSLLRTPADFDSRIGSQLESLGRNASSP